MKVPSRLKHCDARFKWWCERNIGWNSFERVPDWWKKEMSHSSLCFSLGDDDGPLRYPIRMSVQLATGSSLEIPTCRSWFIWVDDDGNRCTDVLTKLQKRSITSPSTRWPSWTENLLVRGERMYVQWVQYVLYEHVQVLCMYILGVHLKDRHSHSMKMWRQWTAHKFV